MPGKDFEQQVREQFSDWRLDPSEKTWGKLEAALMQKKRRRRFAYLTLSAGLLLGALLWGNAYRQQQQQSPADLALQESKSAAGQNADTHSNTPATTSNQASGTQASASNTEQAPVAQAPTAAKNPAAISEAPASAQRRTEENPGASSASAETASRPTPKPLTETRPTDESSVKTPKARRSATQPAVSVTGGPEPVQKNKRSQQVERVADYNRTSSRDAIAAPQSTRADQQAAVDMKTAVAPVAATSGLQTLHRQLQYPPLAVQQTVAGTPAPDLLAPSAEALGPKPATKKGLSVGVSLGMGRSAYGSGLSLSTQKLADQVAGPGGSGSPVTPVLYSYLQDAAFAGELGAWVHWSLSRKWSLRGGLSYQQWNTTTQVGVVSSAGRIFNNGIASVTTDLSYASGRQDTYTNRFHLLSMPIDLEWQLNAGKKLPVIWTLGVVPGVLMSSNVLLGVGDSVLYHHPDNQQRMQWGLRSGLMFRIMPNRQRPIDLGPVFQYQLNRLFESPIPEDGHLQYVGIEARMPILNVRRVQRSK